MKIRILIVLALLGAMLVSLTVGTLSSYVSVSTFGTDIYPDEDKIMQKYEMKVEPEEDFSSNMETGKETVPDESRLPESFIDNDKGSEADLKEDSNPEDEAGPALQEQGQ